MAFRTTFRLSTIPEVPDGIGNEKSDPKGSASQLAWRFDQSGPPLPRKYYGGEFIISTNQIKSVFPSFHSNCILFVKKASRKRTLIRSFYIGFHSNIIGCFCEKPSVANCCRWNVIFCCTFFFSSLAGNRMLTAAHLQKNFASVFPNLIYTCCTTSILLLTWTVCRKFALSSLGILVWLNCPINTGNFFLQFSFKMMFIFWVSLNSYVEIALRFLLNLTHRPVTAVRDDV